MVLEDQFDVFLDRPGVAMYETDHIQRGYLESTKTVINTYRMTRPVSIPLFFAIFFIFLRAVKTIIL